MSLSASLIIPTHNRRDVLARTLRRLHALGDDIETIVVDNASTDGTDAMLRQRFPWVRAVLLDRNAAAAARNVGAQHAESDLLVMLDDDSHLDRGAIERMRAALDANERLAVAAALVRRPGEDAKHETGGLPGVFIGCGAGIRRDVFLELGGYPADYEFYVEEYELCCRLWQGGWRVRTFADIVVTHERVETGRDMDRLLRLLVRNNLWLWRRYAPVGRRDRLVEETIDRYAKIAEKEGAVAGYEAGVREAARPGGSTTGRPLSESEFTQLYGLDDAHEIIERAAARQRIVRVAFFGWAKGAEQLLECVEALGLRFSGIWTDETPASRANADAVLPGTLSPGTCIDLAAAARRRFPSLPVIEPVRGYRSLSPVPAS